MKKICIVTGGSSGIGLSIVKLLLENDYHVFNLDLSPSGFGEFCQCDVTDVVQVSNIINKISKKKAIDVLVSNAGIHFSANIENTSEDDLDKVFNINVKGAYAAVKAVLLDQSLVDQKAVIPGGIPEIVKLTPAVSLNEPNLS